MKRTMVLTALCAGACAATVSAGEPRIGLTLATAQGTVVGAVVRLTDRLTSRTALRVPESDATAELDLTYDVLRGHAFVPYLGAGVELLANGYGDTERTESRGVVGVRHEATARVRLFGEAVWHRRLSGATYGEDANVNIRLGAGVAVMF